MTPKEIEETMKQPRERSIPKKVSNSQDIRDLMKAKRFYRPRSFADKLKRRVTDRPNYYGSSYSVNNEFD